MKITLLWLLIVNSILTIAQDTEGIQERKGLFDVIRNDRSLFTKVPQILSFDESSFSSRFRTSLFLGKRFGRQDLINSNRTNESFYSYNVKSLSINFDYYASSWFSINYKFHLNMEKRKRYDGTSSHSGSEKIPSHHLGFRFDYGNLYSQLFLSDSTRLWPLQNKSTQLYSLKQRNLGLTLGASIYITKPIAIDLFYSYAVKHDFTSQAVHSFTEPFFARVGARIYWAAKMHFGIEIYEENTKVKINHLNVRERNFAVLPYWRF